MLATLATDTTGYRLLLFGHLLCVIVGFGSTFVYPFLGAQASKRKGAEGAAISDATLHTAHIVTTPFIYAAGLFGVLMVILGPYDFDRFWVQAAFTLFVIAMCFSGFVHVPNLTKLNALAQQMAGGPPPGAPAASGPPPQVAEMEARGKAAARNGGILHLIFATILVLMIWRPT